MIGASHAILRCQKKKEKSFNLLGERYMLLLRILFHCGLLVFTFTKEDEVTSSFGLLCYDLDSWVWFVYTSGLPMYIERW